MEIIDEQYEAVKYAEKNGWYVTGERKSDKAVIMKGYSEIWGVGAKIAILVDGTDENLTE